MKVRERCSAGAPFRVESLAFFVTLAATLALFSGVTTVGLRDFGSLAQLPVARCFLKIPTIIRYTGFHSFSPCYLDCLFKFGLRKTVEKCVNFVDYLVV